MGHFSEMEWSTRWDWDNYAAFGSKALESPKKLQLGDWTMDDDGEVDAASFDLSGGGGVYANINGASGSDNGHVSSAKSSISASPDSSAKDGIQTSDFKLFDDCLGNISKKNENIGSEVSGNSPPLEASVGSVEPLIALELGKRTFFENNVSGGNVMKSTSVSDVSNQSVMSQKKLKSTTQNAITPRCLVEGCNADLSTAKEYHRKHRVCDSHSKCPKVIVGGLQRRFCQQCSRFHNLSEFDEKKRSCRKRLSEHNARRRKPHQETIHFNSTRLLSPLFGSGGRPQSSFRFNGASFLQPRTSATSTWDNTFNSKFTITKGPSLEYNENGGNDHQFRMSGISDIHDGKASGLLVSKGLISKAANPGFSSQFDESQGYGFALSLLSTNSSWVSCGPTHPVHMPENDTNYDNGNNNAPQQQPMMQTAVPLSSPESFWLTHNQPTNPTNANFQRLRTPYDQTDCYSDIMH